MDFKNGKELLALCAADEKKISKVMVEREIFLGNVTESQIISRMRTALSIMNDSVHTPLKEPVKSLSAEKERKLWNIREVQEVFADRFSLKLFHMPFQYLR